MIKIAIRKLSYVLFPKRCELCGEVVNLDKNRCDECLKLKFLSGETCNICGSLNDDCKCKKNEKKPEYKCVIAPYYFEGSVVSAIHKFKFFDFPDLAPNMAKDMAKIVKKKYSDINFDYITFVPITKKRRRLRGYNQAQLLANNLSKYLSVPVICTLKKVKNTKTQRGSSINERKNNLHAAFDINIDVANIANKTILLVDDVKTTGSTLNECAMVLKGYGANDVYATTLAITKKM